MSVPASKRLTEQEYLRRERSAPSRSEFLNGEVFAMAGASEAHILITLNVAAELRGQLRGGPCRVYASDMRVKVAAIGLYTYPDVAVVCGDRQFEDGRRDTLLNPTVIVEVLSPSTEAYDRGEKFAHYRRLETVQEYLLISQDRQRLEHFVRQPAGLDWLFSEHSDLNAAVNIPAISCSLSLAVIYEQVEPGTDDLAARIHPT